MKGLRFALPLLIFLGLTAFLWKGLSLNPREVPSPLIGKPVPRFELPTLENATQRLDQNRLRGEVTLVNVWATWCVSCRAEHEVLMALARKGAVPIIGLNYKDERDAAKAWLQRLGNPYAVNLFDADGRVGIDWGVYGTPETVVVDATGIIRHKHIGPLTEAVVEETLLPLVAQLKGQKG